MRIGALLGYWVALLQLAWVFLKVGFVFFGGGFLLVPILHRELVMGLHWLTPKEFVDGVAMSQLTPGPVAILATFCGYRHAGVAGALVATVFVFLPPLALMVLLTRAYGKLRDLPSVQAMMRVFPPAIVGLLVASAADIGRPILTSPAPVILAIACLIAMIRYNVSPAVLIGAGAVFGILTGR